MYLLRSTQTPENTTSLNLYTPFVSNGVYEENDSKLSKINKLIIKLIRPRLLIKKTYNLIEP